MKRIISLLLCLFLIAALCTGCSFSSGKDAEDGKDTAPAENAADKDEKAEPSSEDAATPQGSGEEAGTDGTEITDLSEDTGLPEIEIPFDEDAGGELYDPDEVPDTSAADDAGDPGFTVDEDLITDNDDIRIDENGDTLLPEIP